MTRYSSLIDATTSRATSAAAPIRVDGVTAYVQRQEAQASGRLTPARWEDAKPVIAQLFGLPMKDGTDDAGQIGMMQMSVESEPLWVIKEVVASFIRGECGKGFCPSAPELGTGLRKRTDPIRERLRRARRMAADLETREKDQHCGPLTASTRRLAADAIERLKSVSATEKAATSALDDPFASFRRHHATRPRLAPLTADDLAGVPDAPKRGMRPIYDPGMGPFPKR